MEKQIFDVYFDFCPSETIRESSPNDHSTFVCSCVFLAPMTQDEENNIEQLIGRSRKLKRLRSLWELLKSKPDFLQAHCTVTTEKEFYALSKQIPSDFPALEDIARELNISQHKAASAFAVLKLVHLSIYSFAFYIKKTFPAYKEIPLGFNVLIDRPGGDVNKSPEIYRVINQKYRGLLAGYGLERNLNFLYTMPEGKEHEPGLFCADLLAGVIAGTHLMGIPGTPPDIAEAMTKMSEQLPKFSRKEKKEIIGILDEMILKGILKIYNNIPELNTEANKHT